MSTLAPILLTNTLSGKKESLKTKTPGEVTLYGCGPTVYGYTHVGNARTALTFDLVNRVLKLAGYKTTFMRNITDIDDKIIKVANDEGRSWDEVAKQYSETYKAELKTLKTDDIAIEPKATEHISEMVNMIEGLIGKGLAYASETPFGRDVYFAVKKFNGYGKLSRRKLEDMEAGARVAPGEQKHDPLDFAMWKAAKPGEPSWSSPWGDGRPGWHIECSAMIHKYYPQGIDIHLGGMDLVFPHHENEIAQSEGHSDCQLATYWLHGGMLVLGREKMSKSLGNIFSTQKFLDLYGPDVLRLMCLQHHYRGPMDFSEESIHRAEALLDRLYKSKAEILRHSDVKLVATDALPVELRNLDEEMEAAMFDDFNSAKALGFLLKAVRTCYRENKPEYWRVLKEVLPLINQTFSLLENDADITLSAMKERKLKRLGLSEEKSREIQARIDERETARKNKDFATSDRLRQELEATGVLVMDGPDGAAWTLKDS